MSAAVKPLLDKKERRSRHRTQWAAQFSVASELCKRGYEVSFTMGNTTPLADLMVVSPVSKTMFLVDVKGLYKKNPWVIRRQPIRDNLYYILSYVPDEDVNQHFVLTQADVHSYIEIELKRLGRADDYGMSGILWAQGAGHINAWGILPP